MSKPNRPLERLKHHVTGSIERGEKQAIEAVVSKPKHTPGPWEAVISGPKGSEGEVRQSSTGTLIADCPIFKNNAALIAAAPEGYSRVEQLVHTLKIVLVDDRLPSVLVPILEDEIQKSETWLTKARGES